MAHLMVYAEEALTWPEFGKVKLDPKATLKLVKKFARHFKVPVPAVRFDLRKNGMYHNASIGQLWYRSEKVMGLTSWTIGAGLIQFPQWGSTLALLCHEFAHHLTKCKYPNQSQGHNRRFWRQLKRSYTWGKHYLPRS